VTFLFLYGLFFHQTFGSRSAREVVAFLEGWVRILTLTETNSSSNWLITNDGQPEKGYADLAFSLLVHCTYNDGCHRWLSLVKVSFSECDHFGRFDISWFLFRVIGAFWPHLLSFHIHRRFTFDQNRTIWRRYWSIRYTVCTVKGHFLWKKHINFFRNKSCVGTHDAVSAGGLVEAGHQEVVQFLAGGGAGIGDGLDV